MNKLLSLLAIVVTLNCSAYADHGITARGVSRDKQAEVMIGAVIEWLKEKHNEMPKL